MRLNFGETIVFMQNDPVPDDFVNLAYQEIGKRSNPIITAHTIRWALIELKKFRGIKKTWIEIGAIRKMQYFKNEIENIRKNRKENEESSDSSDEETKERGEIQYDTMANPKMRKLEKDLEKRLEKEEEQLPEEELPERPKRKKQRRERHSETSFSPLSSVPQTPTFLEACETFRNDDSHHIYKIIRDTTIKLASKLFISITEEKLESDLLKYIEKKRYKFGKFLIDINNGKGKVEQMDM